MRVCYNQIVPYPGYETHVAMTLETDRELSEQESLAVLIRPYRLPEGMTMEDREIPGTGTDQDVRIRIFTPALNVLNCPALDDERTTSTNQFGSLTASRRAYPNIGLVTYAELNNGQIPSYYALPGKCRDLRGLGPHMVITAEYDPLRDEGLIYALRLLETGIPCEILSAPRVTHGFCAMPHPLSEWVHRGTAASFRREFGMPVEKI